MNSILLIALLIVCVVGAVFTTLVALASIAQIQELKDAIRSNLNAINEINLELAKIHKFSDVVTDCIDKIGESLRVIDERTDWLNDVDTQINKAFNQNKNQEKS